MPFHEERHFYGKTPVDLYLQHLHIDLNNGMYKRSDIPGVYIDQNECINSEFDYDEYLRDMFIEKMQWERRHNN